MSIYLTLSEALIQQPILFIISCFIIGLLIGSFLNVVIYRLPIMMQRGWQRDCQAYIEASQSPQLQHEENTHTDDAKNADTKPDNIQPFNLITPNSHCPNCDAAVKAWQNIPVISYIFLGGRCHSCKQTISPRYPLLELCCAILSAIVAWKFGFSWSCLLALLLTWGLISLTMIDFDHQLLPDDITLPLIWLGLIANAFNLFVSLESALWGAVVGYLSLWSVFWLFKLLTGKEGMGYGDFKLLAALGAFLGWQMILPIILVASLSGTLIGVILILKSRDKNSQPFAFGPYLAIGGWLALIFDQQLLALIGFV